MRTVGKIALYGSAALGLGFVVLLLVYVWPGGLLTGWGISAPSRYDQLTAEVKSLNAQITELKMAEAQPTEMVADVAPVDEETAYVAAEENSGDTSVVNSPDPVRWNLVSLAKYFDMHEVDGAEWVLPLGTFFAHTTAGGRYEAVASKPVGPQANGTDAGWCGEGQLDCPPHLGLYRVEVTDGVVAVMDIATRVMVDSDEDGLVRFQWRFNTETRTAAELMEDYKVAASGGQLGLFIATADPLMDPATLTFEDVEYLVGYGCWDCLAHTSGVDDRIVSLDDESIGHMGPDTPTLGDSLQPAYVVPVPSPKDDADFAIDLMVEIPKNTTLVVWFGRYDPLDPPG